MSDQELHHTLGSASMIGITAFLGAVVGFGLQLIIAYYFGASADTDAYFMATSTSDLLSKLLLGGSIAAVFLPMFVARLQTENRDEAWKLALNILHGTTLVFLVFLGLLMAFTQPFVHFIAPGFDAPTTQKTVALLRVLLPSFLLLFLVDLTVSMLQALKQFAIPARLRIISPGVSAIVVLVLAPFLGIYALALGVVLGSVVQLSYVGWGLYQQGFRYRIHFEPKDPALRRLVYLVYPFIFSVIVTQGAGIIYRVLVSHLSVGSLSALKYAEKVSQMINIMFLASITTVIFPILSEKASRLDSLGMRQTIASALRLTMFITVPIMVGVAILRQPLVTFIYQHGQFSPEAATLTSIALFWLIVGLSTNALSSVLGHATLALQATRAAVAISIASQVVASILFVLLVPRLGMAGLALASSLVPISSAFLYFLFLTQHIPSLWRIFWDKTLLKIIILGLVLLAVLRYLMPHVSQIAVVQLIIGTVVGSSVFFGLSYMWHIKEMKEVVTLLRRKATRLRLPLV